LLFRYSDDQLSRIRLVGQSEVSYHEVLPLMNCNKPVGTSFVTSASGSSFLQAKHNSGVDYTINVLSFFGIITTVGGVISVD